ncbi:MAG TPA: aminopeptidase P N-terminal domain-containing protein [Polyangiaceae bacterium]|nr:aminopeptidase P N-terminal domain-containing protein [Polyangiaceae bacterium]
MISQEEYRLRRERVLQEIHPGALLLFAAPVSIRNNDVEHEYRQDSDFFYLTGFDEPQAVLLLRSTAQPSSVMFVQPRDPERETWDGPRAGVDGAVRDFGVEQAFPVSELDAKLPELLGGFERLFYRLGDGPRDERVLGAVQNIKRKTRGRTLWPNQILEPDSILHEMRLHKSSSEVAVMRKALEITGRSHVELMNTTRPGMYEYELEGKLRRTFREHGAERPAYSPIVGSGPNATILHHRRNDRRIQEKELVLVDAGCEYGYYASDVTRTFPASGTFTSAQARLYEIVLDAQLAAIEKTGVGATIDSVHQAALEVIVDGLIRVGLIEGPREKALESGSYKTFYMHRTSHYLGMDVHDVGRYYSSGEPRPLEPGVVITVEPGIYVPLAEQYGEYSGIGIRIEDDVLVTEASAEVLSSEIPKTRAEVEQACAR